MRIAISVASVIWGTLSIWQTRNTGTGSCDEPLWLFALSCLVASGLALAGRIPCWKQVAIAGLVAGAVPLVGHALLATTYLRSELGPSLGAFVPALAACVSIALLLAITRIPHATQARTDRRPRMVNVGCLAGVAVNLGVLIANFQIDLYFIEPEPAYSFLVESSPPGATVEHEGTVVGVTPCFVAGRASGVGTTPILTPFTAVRLRSGARSTSALVFGMNGIAKWGGPEIYRADSANAACWTVRHLGDYQSLQIRFPRPKTWFLAYDLSTELHPPSIDGRRSPRRDGCLALQPGKTRVVAVEWQAELECLEGVCVQLFEFHRYQGGISWNAGAFRSVRCGSRLAPGRARPPDDGILEFHDERGLACRIVLTPTHPMQLRIRVTK